MSDVDQLLREYMDEHRSGGEADPVGYLERVEGTDREELRALIDAYLQRAPAREWDAEAYSGSTEERLAESMHRSLGGRAGLWPVLLPRLREHAQVKRAELVEKLATALGASAKEAKVGDYYHGWSRDSLDSDGVSERVLDALGGIVGASPEALRRAGSALGEGAGGAGQASPAFTRMRMADPEADQEAPAAAPASRPEEGEWDEVDELFRGG